MQPILQVARLLPAPPHVTATAVSLASVVITKQWLSSMIERGSQYAHGRFFIRERSLSRTGGYAVSHALGIRRGETLVISVSFPRRSEYSAEAV